jgi:AraC family transcriptional regulator
MHSPPSLRPRIARKFKKSTGLPPHQYVIARRVDRAKQLLVDRDEVSLAQIALEVGFSDQSQFCNHFRRLAGRHTDAVSD